MAFCNLTNFNKSETGFLRAFNVPQNIAEVGNIFFSSNAISYLWQICLGSLKLK